jgi:hypothetical protein
MKLFVFLFAFFAFLFLFAIALNAATPLDPVEAVRKAQQSAPPCSVSVNLPDTNGRPYALICKAQGGSIRIKLTRTMLSGREIRELAEWVERLKSPASLKD